MKNRQTHSVTAAARAGIGLTIALFINGLAFSGTHFEHEAQLAILIDSLLAAAVGFAVLLTSKAPGPQCIVECETRGCVSREARAALVSPP